MWSIATLVVITGGAMIAGAGRLSINGQILMIINIVFIDIRCRTASTTVSDFHGVLLIVADRILRMMRMLLLGLGLGLSRMMMMMIQVMLSLK